jgi:hypothetical protein
VSFEILFGVPDAGWLPVQMRLGESVTEFSASNVLNDPIRDLVIACDGIAEGRACEVKWWLEPSAYILLFQPGHGAVSVSLQFGDFIREAGRREVASTLVPPSVLLECLKASLVQFSALRPRPPAWSAFELRVGDFRGRVES